MQYFVCNIVKHFTCTQKTCRVSTIPSPLYKSLQDFRRYFKLSFKRGICNIFLTALVIHFTCTLKPTKHHQTLPTHDSGSDPHWGWLGLQRLIVQNASGFVFMTSQCYSACLSIMECFTIINHEMDNIDRLWHHFETNCFYSLNPGAILATCSYTGQDSIGSGGFHGFHGNPL